MSLNTPDMQMKASVELLSMSNDNGNWIVTQLTHGRCLLTISLECEMRVSKHNVFCKYDPVHTHDAYISIHVGRYIWASKQSYD